MIIGVVAAHVGGVTLQLQLADFGFAITDAEYRQRRLARLWCNGYGSRFYMAPEALPARGGIAIGGGDDLAGIAFRPGHAPLPPPPDADTVYHPAKHDVWALGVILCNLATQRHPWRVADELRTPTMPFFCAAAVVPPAPSARSESSWGCPRRARCHGSSRAAGAGACVRGGPPRSWNALARHAEHAPLFWSRSRQQTEHDARLALTQARMLGSGSLDGIERMVEEEEEEEEDAWLQEPVDDDATRGGGGAATAATTDTAPCRTGQPPPPHAPGTTRMTPRCPGGPAHDTRPRHCGDVASWPRTSILSGSVGCIRIYAANRSFQN